MFPNAEIKRPRPLLLSEAVHNTYQFPNMVPVFDIGYLRLKYIFEGIFLLYLNWRYNLEVFS